MNAHNVAVVGATGAVGKEMIACLHSERFPVHRLSLFASAKSAGAVVPTPFGQLPIEEFSVDAIKAAGCRIVLLAVSGSFSEEFTPQLVAAGCVVIDNSSAFRYHVDVPLVIPEINMTPTSLPATGGSIIANPNCTTAILAMALFPIHSKFRVNTVIASTYQAASGAGEPGMAELEAAIRARANGQKYNPQVFSHDLCCNVIPAIDVLQPNGYTKEEMKLAWETQKIFAAPDMRVSCTAVRVPTMRAHCIAASIQVDTDITPEEVRDLLSKSPGVVVVDDPANAVYPVPSSASGRADVEVGRIRQSLVFGNRGIDIFICGDQLLRGAALNAVRIAVKLVSPAKA